MTIRNALTEIYPDLQFMGTRRAVDLALGRLSKSSYTKTSRNALETKRLTLSGFTEEDTTTHADSSPAPTLTPS